MNKQELIKRIKDLPFSYIWNEPYLNKEVVLEMIKQLDEPQKVRVSEEEAKFLETFNLNHRTDVTTALYHVSRVGFGYCLTNNDDLELRDLSEEFWDFENRKRLIKAILDGYEVEKEKRYLVKMKAIKSNSQYLVFGQLSEKWWFGSAEQMGNVKSKHTRKQLEEAGFGWVFDCEGIEIEEVE